MNTLQERAELEAKIKDRIWATNKNLVLFDYKPHNLSGFLKLDVVTVNSKSGHSFLLTSTEGNSELQCLTRVIDELNLDTSSKFNYKVVWYKPGEEEIVSHFNVKNGKELFKKIYFDTTTYSIIIKSIELIPIS